MWVLREGMRIRTKAFVQVRFCLKNSAGYSVVQNNVLVLVTGSLSKIRVTIGIAEYQRCVRSSNTQVKK